MKKYQNSFSCYGQSVAGRINYHQKMGVANGIIENIKHSMRNNDLKLDDYKKSFDIGNGQSLTETSVTVVIPTTKKAWLEGECPTFMYNGKIGIIDMLHFGGELQFHIMLYNRETKDYDNGCWHTVRECLTLEQACTLFEYVEDKLTNFIYLPLEEQAKYNSTGAIGVTL